MIRPSAGVIWFSVVATSASAQEISDEAAVVATKPVITVSKNLAAHLRVGDSVDDILKHPAFAGFGRLLLPWDDRRYDTTMPLRNIGSLLPYHSHVDSVVVVSSLNRMIDEASAGRTVFYDIYTDAQKQAEPSRKNTGLFFFRGRPGAPFAVIAPGGGFSYVASVHEGFPYAVEISNRGYNAFVLKYRAGQGGAIATEDLAAALSYIFRNASSLGVTTAGYSLWGSSAGARMAAAIDSYGAGPFGGPDLPKPSALVLLYTGHSDLASTEPPTFLAVGDADRIAPPAIMERRVAALRKVGTEVEYHKYPGVGHGFGLGGGTSAEGWIADALRFWAKQIKGEPIQADATAVIGGQR
jgi:acetyl esterase/lipase